MTLDIRPETPDDIATIYTIEKAAFDSAGEADLVNALRENGNLVLSMVAWLDDKPIGHIAYSPATVKHEAGEFTTIALAPVAVLPEHQKQGAGKALITESLKILAEQGHDLVFLIGHPDYYPRFGFVAAMPQGFDCVYTTPGEPNLHFMVCELVPGALESKSGYLHYSLEFDGL